MAVNVFEAPFYLTESQARWVEETWKSMTLEEKVGQLFCPALSSMNDSDMDELAEAHVGGVMIRPLPVSGLQDQLRALQSRFRVPLMVSGNLENGGSGVVAEGTLYNMPMGCTASGDPDAGYKLGKICAAEAMAVGVNWGFAPIVDIDMNYRNPITNIRAFSSSPDQVLHMARGYLKAAGEEGLLPTIKHFPGDGTDERDQHLLVSVNQLSAPDWYATYGHIYQTLISEGAACVMVGHIAQPAVARDLDPSLSEEEAYMPASQSRTLLTTLLREKLGFQGLIVTDSTLMVGFMQKLPRKQGLCAAIQAGADVILFNRNLAEDLRYVTEGLNESRISPERFRDAVIRVLATKAMMGLPEKQHAGELIPLRSAGEVVGQPLFRHWAAECADRAPALEKDRAILPFTPEKYPRIYLNVIETQINDDSPFAQDMKSRLESRGFRVTLRKRAMNLNIQDMMNGVMNEDAMRVMAEISASTETFTSQYDATLILLNIPTQSNMTTVRVNWSVFAGLGNDIPWYSGEMPILAVSFANPYHLLDIPMAKVYINAWTDSVETREAVLDKLMGKSEFLGHSPVDAFCGHGDARV